MLIVNAKKDEAINFSLAKKIMILSSINGRGYDVCAVMGDNASLNFYAGIERDYDTVQKIFLWLVENKSSRKNVIISEEFISETLEEIETEERKRREEDEWRKLTKKPKGLRV